MKKIIIYVLGLLLLSSCTKLSAPSYHSIQLGSGTLSNSITYAWAIKFCTTAGCTYGDVGGGTFDYISKPNEECNAANVRRVVTVRMIKGTASKDYLVGCRASNMSSDEFLNMMSQNSMATYTFNTPAAGTTALTGGATAGTSPAPVAAPVPTVPVAAPAPAPPAPAAPVAAPSTNFTTGGVAGAGGVVQAPPAITYGWYVPFMNAPIPFNSYNIPVACTASNVGTVVSIKDAAIADRRIYCIASNGNINSNTPPSYTYQGHPDGTLTPLTGVGGGSGQACIVTGNDAPARSQKQFQSAWCSYTQAPYYQAGVAGSYPDGPAGYGNAPEDYWWVTCKHSKPGRIDGSGNCVAN